MPIPHDPTDSKIVEASQSLITTLQTLTPREREILLADPTVRALLMRLHKLLSDVEKET